MSHGEEYDAIVVGARCAGAPTAMLLARKGYRVLVVDRASFPSDTVSTHVIHAPGIAALDRWGLLDAGHSPPAARRSTRYSFDFGPFTIRGTPRPRSTASRRRTRRGAPCSTRSSSTPPREAGAEVREALHRRRGRRRRRRRRRHPRSRRGWCAGRRTGPRRDRRRRTQLARRQGGRAGAVQREADAAVELLHLLERPAGRRLRDLHPARSGLGGGWRPTTA